MNLFKTIELKAKHFKGASYMDNLDCPLARAVKDVVEGFVNEGVNNVKINNIKYLHELYLPSVEREDDKKAQQFNYDDTVIRTIDLYEIT